MDLPLTRIRDYEQQVYAALLGKVVGVYLGRPFEGWSRAAIEQRWGFVDRYVHEELDKPLVVSDDDLTGTLTFIRALEDSALYADTPAEAFGDTWLNYLMEKRTILWWGGRGMSTEHTAYLNLKEGMRAPESGSLARNGRTVAEQIGAQIFIDACGWVAPGRPQLAAEIARRAASVSHDGEAVHAACVVAAMGAAAFAEKRMDRLLDIGVRVIPANSLTARIHADVRAWSAQDNDWRRTWERIDRRYGYHKYGGNCHVVPNHAVMVLAWCHAPTDVRRCLGIAATAGWDTDCNVGNVGAVMGLVGGREGLVRGYDFVGPIADRLILPTAEGSRGVSDIASEALRIAAMGRRVAGEEPLPSPKKGAWHHFALPGSVHGYRSDEADFHSRATTRVASAITSGTGESGLSIEFRDVLGERVSRTSTPVLPAGAGARYGGASQMQACPRLYPGNRVSLEGSVAALDGAASARLFVRHMAGPETTSLHHGPAKRLRAGGDLRLALTVPDLGGWPVVDVGVEIAGAGSDAAAGSLRVDAVRLGGRPRFDLPVEARLDAAGGAAGWVCDADRVMNRPFSDDAEAVMRLGQDEGRAVMITGTDDWRDYTWRSRVNVHLAAAAGIVVRYQGRERYVALVVRGGRLQLVERWYGEESVWGDMPADWGVDELHALELTCKGAKITARCDGEVVAQGGDRRLRHGGAGYLVESGLAGFRDSGVA
jgi:ADP-ribosylglycohydrolase